MKKLKLFTQISITLAVLSMAFGSAANNAFLINQPSYTINYDKWSGEDATNVQKELFDNNGNLFFGTNNSGLWEMKKGQTSPKKISLTTSDGEDAGVVNDLCYSKFLHKMLIATNIGCFIYDSDNNTYSFENNLATNLNNDGYGANIMTISINDNGDFCWTEYGSDVLFYSNLANLGSGKYSGSTINADGSELSIKKMLLTSTKLIFDESDLGEVNLVALKNNVAKKQNVDNPSIINLNSGSFQNNNDGTFISGQSVLCIALYNNYLYFVTVSGSLYKYNNNDDFSPTSFSYQFHVGQNLDIPGIIIDDHGGIWMAVWNKNLDQSFIYMYHSDSTPTKPDFWTYKIHEQYIFSEIYENVNFAINNIGNNQWWIPTLNSIDGSADTNIISTVFHNVYNHNNTNFININNDAAEKPFKNTNPIIMGLVVGSIGAIMIIAFSVIYRKKKQKADK